MSEQEILIAAGIVGTALICAIAAICFVLIRNEREAAHLEEAALKREQERHSQAKKENEFSDMQR